MKQVKRLFIIHGWAYSVEPWKKTIDYLEEAGVHVRILYVPGLTSASSKAWAMDEYIEWLHEQIKNEKDIVVLGHSNGGRILMNYDIAHPGVVQKMILLNSAGVYENPKAISVKRRAFRIGSKLIRPLRYIPPIRKVLYRIIGAGDYEKAPAHMKVTLRNMLKSDALLDPSKCTAQVVLLWGARDLMTPLAQGKKLHTLIKKSTLRIVDNWNHVPYREHPKELAETILQELAI